MKHKFYEKFMLIFFCFILQGCSAPHRTHIFKMSDFDFTSANNLKELNKAYDSVSLMCNETLSIADYHIEGRHQVIENFSIFSVITGAGGAVFLAASPANIVIAATLSASAGVFAALDYLYGNKGQLAQRREYLLKNRQTLTAQIKEKQNEWDIKNPSENLLVEIIRKKYIVSQLAALCFSDIPKYPLETPETQNK